MNDIPDVTEDGVERLALGEYGLLRRIDLSEQYVNKTVVLAKNVGKEALLGCGVTRTASLSPKMPPRSG